MSKAWMLQPDGWSLAIVSTLLATQVRQIGNCFKASQHQTSRGSRGTGCMLHQSEGWEHRVLFGFDFHSEGDSGITE